MATYKFTGEVTYISCEKSTKTKCANNIRFLGDPNKTENKVWYVAEEKVNNKNLLRIDKDCYFTAEQKDIFEFILANKNEKMTITFDNSNGEDGSEKNPYHIIKAELKYD